MNYSYSWGHQLASLKCKFLPRCPHKSQWSQNCHSNLHLATCTLHQFSLRSHHYLKACNLALRFDHLSDCLFAFAGDRLMFLLSHNECSWSQTQTFSSFSSYLSIRGGSSKSRAKYPRKFLLCLILDSHFFYHVGVSLDASWVLRALLFIASVRPSSLTLSRNPCLLVQCLLDLIQLAQKDWY